jgi:methionyl-tRNA formyltransferase
MTSPNALRYEYATGELLDSRNTYSYTAYHGTDFLVAWSQHRDTSLRSSSDATTPNSKPQPRSATALLLRHVQTRLTNEEARAQALATLNHLLQRFEVTKRIHSEYNANWRPVNPQDYYDLDLYLLFAQTLDQAYALTRGLQYLNGLLKCLDTLTAYLPALNSGQIGNLQTLVRAERAHVERLRLRLDGRAA